MKSRMQLCTVAPRGLSLIEVAVVVLIMALAITAAGSSFMTHNRAALLTEGRRTAAQFAMAKIDELRLAVANGESLELLFQRYGPLDYTADPLNPPIKCEAGSVITADANGYLHYASGLGDPATFVVGEDANNNGVLDIGEDLDNNGLLNTYLTPLPGRPLGSVTIITSENPNEGDFGVLYGQAADVASTDWFRRNPFGVDITGNRTYADALPSPFPLDINGDGDSEDTVNGEDGTRDLRDDTIFDETTNSLQALRFLPVVITIQWQGPYGPERMDVFSIIAKERP